MSNAKLRQRLERTSPAVLAAMIDNGDAHDECGILELSYAAYCNPGRAFAAAYDRTQMRVERPRL